MKADAGLEMKYFVLNPTKHTPYGAASRGAMLKYAEEIRHENPTLARDIVAWIHAIIKRLEGGDEEKDE